MPEISVIVPVYKVEAYLRRCVDSILAQTFTDYELWLVDDGSPDNCGKICDEYARNHSRILVIHQENAGVSVARNNAIDLVISKNEGNWICFVDADDWIHPQYIESLLYAVKKYRVQIAVAKCRRVTEEAKFEKLTLKCHEMPSINVYESFLHEGVNLAPWAKIYHKNCFNSIRFPVGRFWEDVSIMYLIILKETKISVLDDIIYFYYSNLDSTIRKKWSISRLDELTAYEEQKIFFRKQEKYKLLFNLLLRKYIQVIAEQFYLLSNTGKEEDKKKYLPYLSQKCKDNLREYRKYGKIPFFENKFIYEVAYPHLMLQYWRIYGVINKIVNIIKG